MHSRDSGITFKTCPRFGRLLPICWIAGGSRQRWGRSVRLSGSVMTGCHRGWRRMHEGSLMMAWRLLTISGSRLAMMRCVMRRLVWGHERSLAGRRVWCVRIRVHSAVTGSTGRPRGVRRIVMRCLIRHLRQRMQHVMWKILCDSLDCFLIHSYNDRNDNL